MNEEKENKITLYPSNWLYNAGVVGLLRVLGNAAYNVNSCLKISGEVQLDNFDKLVNKLETLEVAKDQQTIEKFQLEIFSIGV